MADAKSHFSLVIFTTQVASIFPSIR